MGGLFIKCNFIDLQGMPKERSLNISWWMILLYSFYEKKSLIEEIISINHSSQLAGQTNLRN